MRTVRTDLAMESHRLWQESAGKTTTLQGVKAVDGESGGFPTHRVDILDREGEKALGKPRGTYVTLDISQHRKKGFAGAAEALAELLAPMVPEEGPVLVAGLGNAAMTPDALGHETVKHLLVTRHLGKLLPTLRPVSALAAGVLGTTGMEAAEWVRGVAARVQPAAVIIVDALAARDLERLCTTVQLSDTGLIPGSGVGNHRMALNRDTLGVPVISMGVPTVVDAATVARDMLRRSGAEERESAALQGLGSNFFVTPDSIDQQVGWLGKILGYGITLALQPELAVEDVTALLE